MENLNYTKIFLSVYAIYFAQALFTLLGAQAHLTYFQYLPKIDARGSLSTCWLSAFKEVARLKNRVNMESNISIVFVLIACVFTGSALYREDHVFIPWLVGGVLVYVNLIVYSFRMLGVLDVYEENDRSFFAIPFETKETS